MVILRYNILFLLGMLICTSVSAQKMQFHNYNVENTAKAEFLDTINVPIIQTALFSISNVKSVYGYSFKKLDKPSMKQLLQIDFISGWNEELTRSRSDYIESEINSTGIELKMYLTSYSWSKKYDTFLLLVEKMDQDGFLKVEELLMINTKSKRILSIAKIATSYLCEGDWEQSFSLLYENECFLNYNEHISSDVILPKKKGMKSFISKITLDYQTALFRAVN